MKARWLSFGLLLLSWDGFTATQWIGQPVPMELYKPHEGPFTPAEPVETTIQRPDSDNPDATLPLPVKITYPTDSPGPFPVIVFSHRFRGTMNDFAPMMERWVSHGYVVLQPQHRDSRNCEENCTTTSFLEQTDRAAEIAATIEQLDEVLAAVPGLDERVDHHVVGLAGYGYGANTVQMAGNSEKYELAIPAGAVFALSPPADYVGQDAAARADQVLSNLLGHLPEFVADLLGSPPPIFSDARDFIISDLLPAVGLDTPYPLQPSEGSRNPLMVVTGGYDDVYRSFFIEKIMPGLLPWVYNRSPWYEPGTGDGFLTTDSWRWRINDYGTLPIADQYLLVIAGAQQNFGGASGQEIAPVSPGLLEQCSQILQTPVWPYIAGGYGLMVDVYNELFGLINLEWNFPIQSIDYEDCGQLLIGNHLSWDEEGDPNAPYILEDLYATSTAFFDSYLKRNMDARVYLATDITCLATRQSALYYHSGYGEPEGGASGVGDRDMPPVPVVCTNR